jgi:hypothetical protein
MGKHDWLSTEFAQSLSEINRVGRRSAHRWVELIPDHRYAHISTSKGYCYDDINRTQNYSLIPRRDKKPVSRNNWKTLIY